MISTTRRQRQILTKLRALVSSNIKVSGKTKSTKKATLNRERVKRWLKDCSENIEGVMANYRIFADRFSEKVQLFDLTDRTVYEYVPGKNFKQKFLQSVFRTYAMQRLNELNQITLVFVTTPDQQEKLINDPLARLVQFTTQQGGLRIDIRDDAPGQG